MKEMPMNRMAMTAWRVEKKSFKTAPAELA
jgi:hypothetical protein